MIKWAITLLLFVISCRSLTEEELEMVKKVIDTRPNIAVNGINSSKVGFIPLFPIRFYKNLFKFCKLNAPASVPRFQILVCKI